MALRLHQITGEPLAHCSYLLDQTNGDYETALKILERILEQRTTNGQGQSAAAASDATASPPQQSLEERVERLESQMTYLLHVLDTMSKQLTSLLEKLPDSDGT
jgi:hypothetical protein